MKLPTKKKIARFQKKILSWYQQHKRDLPWRNTKSSYHILISEVMLQQTQVDRVINYYERWLKELPTFEALSKVSTKKLLKLWSGLGYNTRALRLRKLAKEVVKQHKGKLPKTYEELIALPGIGDYTANAILAFAFNKEVPVMDTNIRRVLIHELKVPEDILLERLKEIASDCVPKKKSCVWHNALMDYGALHKTARKTGIRPLSRQGTFEGSDRQVRGFIAKQLIQKPFLQMNEVEKKFPDKDIDAIVEKMIKEGIVRKRKSVLTLC